MDKTGVEVKIRPMNSGDIDAALRIDRKIRNVRKAITYANLATAKILTVDRKAGHRVSRPTSYADMVTGDVAGMLEYSFVAEVGGRVRGFILGRVAHVGESENQVGLVLILGIHPDNMGQGFGAKLVEVLMEKYRSNGIRTIRIGIDERDDQLRGFFEHMGFTRGRAQLVDYTRVV